MKRSIVVDVDGLILATAPHHEPGGEVEAGAPRHWGFVPLEGQQVHIVEVPEHLHSQEGLVELHRSHRIVVRDGKAHLVKAK